MQLVTRQRTFVRNYALVDVFTDVVWLVLRLVQANEEDTQLSSVLRGIIILKVTSPPLQF